MRALRVFSYATIRGEVLPLLVAAETRGDASEALEMAWGYTPEGTLNVIPKLWHHTPEPEVIFL